MSAVVPTPVPERMTAVVCYGPQDYRLESRPIPRPAAGEVLVKVLSSGICASDIKCYLGAEMFWGTDEQPGYCQPPVTPGHEFVAEVVAFGEGAAEKHGLALAERVISEQIVPCWNCRYCARGKYWMCPFGNVYGFRQKAFGAWAEYMVFPAGAIIHKVPDDIPLHHAVFIEPLACSVHAVERGNIQYQDTVVIAGCGPLGLGMVAAAKLKGPARIIALDLSEERLSLAKRCGADLTLNPATSDVVDEVKALTEGYGCDVYIEATGHPSAVTQGLEMVCRLGTFVEFSVMREPVTTDWTIIGDSKELNIHGAHLGPYCYPVAIRMLQAGRLPMDAIVTHRLTLTDFQTGLDLVAAAKTSVKVTLEP